MTDDIYDGTITPPIIPCGDPLAYGDLWDAFWTDFDAREAGKSHGPLPVLDVDELEARPPRIRTAAFEAQAFTELVDPAFGADPAFAAFAATKPFLTTREATAYCGFKTAGALRKAKLEGRIAPAGRRGGSGTLMWSREALDRYLQGAPLATVPAGRARTLPEATGGTHEEQAVGSEVEQLGGGATDSARSLSTKPESIYERREGFSFEGERSIRRMDRRGRLSEACRT